ncbi:hypothetical protein BLNAU_7005 [Blattamonas nauphoetae]|uniref:Uncharacterized protein n=1 Tax=Blattamonas nauphoetae TaxID=2049346 RepID=A0ABQ9Y2V5_9EUKA|nr:hypothetical protein BLNAU_7005 [Blattamonas nauphoetae]
MHPSPTVSMNTINTIRATLDEIERNIVRVFNLPYQTFDVANDGTSVDKDGFIMKTLFEFFRKVSPQDQPKVYPSFEESYSPTAKPEKHLIFCLLAYNNERTAQAVANVRFFEINFLPAKREIIGVHLADRTRWVSVQHQSDNDTRFDDFIRISSSTGYCMPLQRQNSHQHGFRVTNLEFRTREEAAVARNYLSLPDSRGVFTLKAHWYKPFIDEAKGVEDTVLFGSYNENLLVKQYHTIGTIKTLQKLMEDLFISTFKAIRVEQSISEGRLKGCAKVFFPLSVDGMRLTETCLQSLANEKGKAIVGFHLGERFNPATTVNCVFFKNHVKDPNTQGMNRPSLNTGKNRGPPQIADAVVSSSLSRNAKPFVPRKASTPTPTPPPPLTPTDVAPLIQQTSQLESGTEASQNHDFDNSGELEDSLSSVESRSSKSSEYMSGPIFSDTSPDGQVRSNQASSQSDADQLSTEIDPPLS